MHSFKLIRIDEKYEKSVNILVSLWVREKLCLADASHIQSVPKDLRDRMQKLDRNTRVIILSRSIAPGQYAMVIPDEQLFPFCSIHKNGGNISLMYTNEALRHGNYLLCHEREEIDVSSPRHNTEETFTRTVRGEYRCHVELEEVERYRNNPPYVNLDRTDEAVGYSSWDGNLVSWFRSGFQSRILYGVHSGLFPEE